MLKPQDIVLLLKLIARPENLAYGQNQLATHLCVSVSEINAGFKRLQNSGLLQPDIARHKYQYVRPAIEEFLLTGLKYVFPARLGEQTRGIATSYGAPVLAQHIAQGTEPIPVWPFAQGKERGLALEPLYRSVPLAISQYPEEEFYDLLVLVDAIRQGRTRERQLAAKLLTERLPGG
jgi:hypothetical protein